MSIPTALEIRKFLPGYGLDLTSTKSKTGDTAISSYVIANILTFDLESGMIVSGVGIPVGSKIVTVDSVSQVTIDHACTANGTGISITITYFSVISDPWIEDKRDGYVIPMIERMGGFSVTGDRQHTKVYSGTGSPTLMLDFRNLKSIDDVMLLSGVSPSPINVSEIEVMRWEGMVRAKQYIIYSSYIAYFPRGTNNIKVVFTVYKPEDADIRQIICSLVCLEILTEIEGRTGGGDISAQSFSRSFGVAGKYTNIRKALNKRAIYAMRKYMTAVKGN